MTTPTHMVELRDVCMQFEDKKVLDGCSLKVQEQTLRVMLITYQTNTRKRFARII